MDSFELNKIIGAVLGTLLFIMGVGFLAEAIYHPIEDRGPGFTLPEPEGTAGAEGGEDEPVVVADIGTILAAADATEGQGQARKCQSCHNLVEGGPNGQGPNLYGIVGRPIASHPGFAYSEAMVAHAAEAPDWTYEELNAFLLAPKQHIPGTKMNFAGVPDDAERGNIIAFLATLSPSPVPFPAPAAAPAAAEPPAEGAASAAEAPAAGTEATPVETPDAGPTETPVEGTSTTTNVPAGGTEVTNPAAETPAEGATTPAAQ